MNPGSTPKPATVRLVEIDGMRAVVSLWVVFDHFGLSALVGMHYGFLGVRMMLVLSAYFAAKQLRLLWGSGPAAETPAIAGKLVHYYSSRVVRLGLLTYTTIALGILLNVESARDTWGWHALFATNHYIIRFEEWPGALSHFWSLAVQMQFLLLLPVLLLLTPRRWLWPMLAAGVLASLGHRASVLLGGASDFHRWMPVSNSLDAFALGIGLAWVEKERPAWFHRLKRPWAWGTGLAAMVVALWLRGHAYETLPGILTETVEAAGLVLLFGALVGGFTFGPVGHLLRFRPLVLLGGASLSLYALHPLVEQMLGRFWHYAQVATFLPSPLFFQFTAVALALFVAWGAFHLLEIPARQIATGIEPGLTRWLTRVAEAQPHRRAALWRFQPVSAVFVGLLLAYGAMAPLRTGSPVLNPETANAPVAVETMEELMEEAQDAQDTDFPEIPAIESDLLNLNVA